MITWSELEKVDNPKVIDIRSRNSYIISHYPKARNIDSMKLIARPENYLDKKETYYIYCQNGTSSNKICQILNKKKYNTINIIGGYKLKN